MVHMIYTYTCDTTYRHRYSFMPVLGVRKITAFASVVRAVHEQ